LCASDVATAAAFITAVKSTVSFNECDKTATVGSDVVPVADATVAGTPTVADDTAPRQSAVVLPQRMLAHPHLPSPTTTTTLCHFVVAMLALLAFEGSQRQQLSSLLCLCATQ